MSFASNTYSQLFEFDRVELALHALLEAQGIPAQRKRDRDTNVTPRVELDFESTGATGQRYTLVASQNSQFQPHNCWTFRLTVTVVTNREQNADSHGPLVGIARGELTMHRLRTTFTQALCPTHQIIETREESAAASVWNEGGNDQTEITLIGLFAVRDTAWANLS